MREQMQSSLRSAFSFVQGAATVFSHSFECESSVIVYPSVFIWSVKVYKNSHTANKATQNGPHGPFFISFWLRKYWIPDICYISTCICFLTIIFTSISCISTFQMFYCFISIQFIFISHQLPLVSSIATQLQCVCLCLLDLFFYFVCVWPIIFHFFRIKITNDCIYSPQQKEKRPVYLKFSVVLVMKAGLYRGYLLKNWVLCTTGKNLEKTELFWSVFSCFFNQSGRYWNICPCVVWFLSQPIFLLISLRSFECYRTCFEVYYALLCGPSRQQAVLTHLTLAFLLL